MIGRLHERILKSIEETIPLEFSVLDAEDKVIAWNKHETRIFKRPIGALGKNVRDCHPRDSLVKVEQILAEMKKKRRDKARFWIDLGKDDKKMKVLIEYYALRDGDGKYLGCLELTQDITEIQRLSGEKRLLNEI